MTNYKPPAICISLLVVALSSPAPIPALSAEAPAARKAYANAGRLYVVGTDGKAKVLPGFSKVKDAALSPDGMRVVFIKGTTGLPIPTGSGDAPPDQLWLVDANGAHPTLLVGSRRSPKSQNVLGGFTEPCFSPDNRRVYFLSRAYAVSDAVHVVDVATRATRFVCAGNTVEVVPKGAFAGDLIVQQHRYFAGSGSYDWYWLLDTRGKDINAIGTEAQLRQFKSDL